MLAQRGDERRPARLDSLQRHAARLARERDQAEAAGRHHRELRQLVVRFCVTPALAELHGAVHLASACRRVDGAPGCRVGRRGLRQGRAQVAEGLVRVGVLDLHVLRLRVARRLHEVLERDAVALEERLALRLPVVRQDDEVVRPRGVLRGAGDAADLAVHAAQDRQSVGSLHTRVMCDLVVGEKRRVADGPARVHVRNDGLHLEVGLHDRAPGAHERVLAIAVPARADILPPLLCREAPLLRDVGDHERDRAGDAVRVGEVGEVVLADPPRAVSVQHGAHREQRVNGVAGHDVRAARAIGVQQPTPVRMAPLDLGRVARMVGDDRCAAVLLPPPERRDVVVVAVEQPRLAGAGLRGPVCLPPEQAVVTVVHPAREVRCVAVPDRALQHVIREPVDLEEVDARGAEVALRAKMPDAALDHVAVPEVVVVDGQQGGDGRVDDGQPERDRHGGADPLHVHAGLDRSDRADHGPVQQEHAQPQREHGEWERDPDDDRPNQGVDEADQRGRDEGGGTVLHVETREQRAHEHQGRGRGQPDEEDAEEDGLTHTSPRCERGGRAGRAAGGRTGSGRNRASAAPRRSTCQPA